VRACRGAPLECTLEHPSYGRRFGNPSSLDTGDIPLAYGVPLCRRLKVLGQLVSVPL